MYNITDSLTTNWTERSIRLHITDKYKPILLFSMILGVIMIIHSWYLKGFKYNKIRLMSEICSLSMIGSSYCFLSCIDEKCNLFTKTLLYNIVTESFLIPITMICDTYLTFKRYSIIVNNTTSLYRSCVFIYWCLFMVLPWCPFYNILPIWYDQNSDFWKKIRFNSIYVSMISVVSYYLYFFVMVYLELKKLNTKSLSVRSLYLLEFIIRSLGHTTCSITGMILTMIYFPEGTIYIYIINSIGIHIFLNCKIDVSYFIYLINSQKIFNIYAYFTTKKVSENADEVTMLKDAYSKGAISNRLESGNKIYIESPVILTPSDMMLDEHNRTTMSHNSSTPNIRQPDMVLVSV